MILLLLNAPALATADSVAWRRDLDAAKVEAAENQKLVLLHFWTPSCGPCRGLDKNVFSQAHFGSALEQNYIPVKVNADQAPALAAAFGVNRVPTDIVLTSQGNVLASLACPAKPEAYLEQAASVAQHFQQQGALAQSTSSQTAAVAAYAGLQVGVPAPSQAQTVQNKYPAQTPAVVQSASGGPATVRNPYTVTPETNPAPSAVVATPAAHEATAENPPLALDGFCPVSLRAKRAWTKGDAKIGAIHRGQTFLFAAEAERSQFLANPDAYSPVFSGLDPVLLLDQNKAVPGSRAFGFDYMGAFYLFSSAETKAAFAAKPSDYAVAVREAMLRVDSGAGTLRR
ncbi:MAG: thioredoxin family protein [Planctomycetota bacterium]